MKLSILIPVFFGEDIFEECLNSLYRSAEGKLKRDWEILAYNNGFSPERWQELGEIFPEVRFFGEGKNVGFAEANNFLLRESKGEFILFLNQDVLIRPLVIEKLIDFLEKNKEYDCVAPKLIYKNQEVQYSCRPFPTLSLFVKDFFTGGKSYRFFYSPEVSQEVDQPMASCLLWRKKTLRKLGGFDAHPHFFLYFNDVDLSYRLVHDLKGKSYFLADLFAFHYHGSSAYVLPERERLFLWFKGLGRFWYKKEGNY